jgi:hypothetical protein
MVLQVGDRTIPDRRRRDSARDERFHEEAGRVADSAARSSRRTLLTQRSATFVAIGFLHSTADGATLCQPNRHVTQIAF